MVYTATISALEQWPKALQLFEDLQDRSLEADVILHNAVVSGCDTREQWKKSSSMFSKLRCRSIQASLISFNTFISTCDKSGHWEQAAACLMRLERGLQADAISYNAMMSSSGSANCWQLAVDSYARLRQAHIQPTRVTCNTAIATCRHWQRTLRVLSEGSKMSLFPDVISYCSAMSACEKAALWQMAFCLFASMTGDQLQATSVCYNTLISACASGHQWQRAVILFYDSGGFSGAGCADLQCSYDRFLPSWTMAACCKPTIRDVAVACVC